MTAQLVQLPVSNLSDIPERLRTLAAQVESGDFQGAYNLVWVLDMGGGKIETGLMGHAAEPAATAYLLLGFAQFKFAKETVA